jgi:hypothetical protein
MRERYRLIYHGHMCGQDRHTDVLIDVTLYYAVTSCVLLKERYWEFFFVQSHVEYELLKGGNSNTGITNFLF